MYRIGEIAERLGISTQTLRFYEREGLAPAPARSDKGYRLYSEADLRKLRFILRGKEVGLSNHELYDLVRIRNHSDTVPCSEVKEIIDAKLVKVREQIVQLQAFESSLQQLSDGCDGGSDMAENCSILTRLDAFL